MRGPQRHKRIDLDEDVYLEIPEGAALDVELRKRSEGGAAVLAQPESVEESLEHIEGEGVLLEVEGTLGSDELTVGLPKARPGDRFVAIALDENDNPYLTGLPIVAELEGTRLPVRLHLYADDDGRDEGAVLISPGRVTKLWIKKVLHLPARELGLFEVAPGPAGSLQYRPAGEVEDAERAALVVHGALSELRAMEDLCRYLLSDDCPRRYERVLGFEYETVATPIADNGRALAKALEDRRLPMTRRVDVFAYSMGTQVTRSLLELYGAGDRIGEVVLIAPPNGGTRLAADQDRLLKLGSLVLASRVDALSFVLGLLFRALERNDQGLDDLRPDSGFHRLLSRKRRAWREPYKTISGVLDESPRHLIRLLGKAAHGYFGEDSDWVVPVSSVRRGPVAEPAQVGSNHFGFFRDQCGSIEHLLYGWLK